MKKKRLLFLGIILTILGLFFNILYVNILVLGYSFFDYVHFINSRIECLVFYIGIILVIVVLKKKG